MAVECGAERRTENVEIDETEVEMRKQVKEWNCTVAPTHVVVIYGENDSTGAYTPVEYKECRGRLELDVVESLLIEAEMDFTTYVVH